MMLSLQLLRCFRPVHYGPRIVISSRMYRSTSLVSKKKEVGTFSVDRSALAQFEDVVDIDSIEGTVKEKATPLARDLHSYVGWRGPMSLHDYIAQALNHTVHGYYQSKVEKIGESGDFVTAPELGQLFGEMIGVWCVTTWQAMGKPSKVNIVELGPGKGTLMQDLLKVIQKVPEMKNKFDIHFVELSQSLRLEQLAAINATKAPAIINSPVTSETTTSSDEQVNQPVSSSTIKDGEEYKLTEEVSVYWHSVLGKVPNNAPCIIIAQEFLDAFPVHQFVFSNGGWKEKLVDIDTNPETPYHFRIIQSRGPTPAVKTLITTENENIKKLLMPNGEKLNSGKPFAYGIRAQKNTSNGRSASAPGLTEGDGLEICPLAISTVEGISQRVVATGGAALIIDYGEDFTQEDTLRGFYKHTQKDILSEPGRVDITADVDFALCRKSAQRHHAKVLPLQTQGNFLVNMGIIQRVEQLLEADHITDEEANMLFESMQKLVDPKEMGSKFKVMSIVHPSLENLVVGFPTDITSHS